MKKLKYFALTIVPAALLCLGLSISSNKSIASGSAWECGQRIVISDNVGNRLDYEYKKYRHYKLSVGNSYLLYIGAESGGLVSGDFRVSTISGISYDNVSFDYDATVMDITRLDNCSGGFFVITGKQPCDNAVVSVTLKHDESSGSFDVFSLFDDFRFSVMFAEEV